MSTKSTADQKRTDHQPLRHFYLGQDGEGDFHHFDRERNTVYTITADGERTFTDYLTADQISAYREYVESRRGDWQEIVILPLFLSTVLG